jgi:hypothetical protein
LTKDQVYDLVGKDTGDDLFNYLGDAESMGPGGRGWSTRPTEFKGTHNYVIFNPKDIQITGRNGEKLPASLQPVDHDPFAGAP